MTLKFHFLDLRRYDNISSNLEKSERERLFDEHIDYLVAKKKENYRKLLDEQKSITLDSNFKDIKKLIRDDPRYQRLVRFTKVKKQALEVHWNANGLNFEFFF